MLTDLILASAQLWVPLLVLGLGYFAGRSAERTHYASIHAREESMPDVPLVTARTLHDDRPVAEANLVTGSVVVSIDAYKRFAMSLRNLVGGEARGYSSLIDRARREALLRMRESFPEADVFLNFRMETATLFSGRGKNPGSVEIVAYATAIRFADS